MIVIAAGVAELARLAKSARRAVHGHGHTHSILVEIFLGAPLRLPAPAV